MRTLVRPIIVVLRKSTQTIFAQRNLLYTNIGLSVGISVVGDAIQQKYQHSKENSGSAFKWQVLRTRQMAAAGFVAGPFAHYWYYYLDKFFPGRNLKTVLIKLCLDQFICSPIWIMVFLLTTGVAQGLSWQQFKQGVRDKSLGFLTVEFLVWPPAQFVNFYFLPTRFRVLYDNVVSLCVEVLYSYVLFDYVPKSDRKELASAESEDADMVTNKVLKIEEVSLSPSVESIQSVFKTPKSV